LGQKHGKEVLAMTFEDLDAWKTARLMVKRIYALTRQPGLRKDFGLTGQIQRAGVSVMSNVAEGFERVHAQEKFQLYNVAHASAGEVRSLLYVIEDNYPDCAPDAVASRQEAAHTGSMVGGLVRATTRRSTARKLVGAMTAILGIWAALV
jgi:four helix bundle protein